MNVGAIMKKYGIKPKHKLGQNFLVNDVVLAKIVDAAELKPTDNVLEIGAGLGVLTQELIKRAKRVLSVEVDRSLVYVLKQTFRQAQGDKNNEAQIASDDLAMTRLVGGQAGSG